MPLAWRAAITLARCPSAGGGLSAQEEVARLETARGASAGERAASEYNLACRYALAGRADSAITALRQALLLRPELALHARHDDDLTTLREHPAIRAHERGRGRGTHHG